MTFFNWLRWLVNGHKRFASLCAKHEALSVAFHETSTRLEELRADHDQQLSHLRAIVTQHSKEQPPPMRQARRFSEIRNVLKQREDDEDAA